MRVQKTNVEIGFENLRTAKKIENKFPPSAYLLAKAAFSKFKELYEDKAIHGKAGLACSMLEACAIVMRTSANKYKDKPIEELNLHVGTELEFATSAAKELGGTYPKVLLAAADVHLAYCETVAGKMKDANEGAPQYPALVMQGITQSLEALKIFDQAKLPETFFIPLKIMDAARTAIFFLEERQKALDGPSEKFGVKDRVVPEGFIQQFKAINYSLGRVDAGMGKVVESLDGKKFHLAREIPSNTSVEALGILRSLYKLADAVLSDKKTEISIIDIAIRKCTHQQSSACQHKTEFVCCFVV